MHTLLKKMACICRSLVCTPRQCADVLASTGSVTAGLQTLFQTRPFDSLILMNSHDEMILRISEEEYASLRQSRTLIVSSDNRSIALKIVSGFINITYSEYTYMHRAYVSTLCVPLPVLMDGSSVTSFELCYRRVLHMPTPRGEMFTADRVLSDVDADLMELDQAFVDFQTGFVPVDEHHQASDDDTASTISLDEAWYQSGEVIDEVVNDNGKVVNDRSRKMTILQRRAAKKIVKDSDRKLKREQEPVVNDSVVSDRGEFGFVNPRTNRHVYSDFYSDHADKLRDLLGVELAPNMIREAHRQRTLEPHLSKVRALLPYLPAAMTDTFRRDLHTYENRQKRAAGKGKKNFVRHRMQPRRGATVYTPRLVEPLPDPPPRPVITLDAWLPSRLRSRIIMLVDFSVSSLAVLDIFWPVFKVTRDKKLFELCEEFLIFGDPDVQVKVNAMFRKCRNDMRLAALERCKAEYYSYLGQHDDTSQVSSDRLVAITTRRDQRLALESVDWVYQSGIELFPSPAEDEERFAPEWRPDVEGSSLPEFGPEGEDLSSWDAALFRLCKFLDAARKNETTKLIAQNLGVFFVAREVKTLRGFIGLITAISYDETLAAIQWYLKELMSCKVEHVYESGLRGLFEKASRTRIGGHLFGIFATIGIHNLYRCVGVGHLFSVSTWPDIIAKAVNNVPHKADQILVKVLDFLEDAVTAFTECWNEGSLTPLFRTCKDFDSWYMRATALTRHSFHLVDPIGLPNNELFKDLMARGELPPEWNTPFPDNDALINEAKQLVLEGEKFGEMPGQSVFRVQAIQSLLRHLRFLVQQASHDNGMAAERIQPMGIAFVGPAGIGKTAMLKTLHKSLGERMGFPTGESSVYCWLGDANFQDGLNHHKWFIRIEDIDVSVAPATAGCTNHVQVVMRVVDNKPFAVEAAAVEQKGMLVARPLLVGYTSNFPDFRLRGYTAMPSAFYRRLRYKVRMVVRPECMLIKPVGNQSFEEARQYLLDHPEKRKPDPNCNELDVHSIEVAVYNPDKFDEKNPFSCDPYDVVRSDMTNREFLHFMGLEFEAHLKAQREFLQRDRSPVGCVYCYMPGCPGCTYQSTALTLFSILAFWDWLKFKWATWYLRRVKAEFYEVVASKVKWVALAACVGLLAALVLGRTTYQARKDNSPSEVPVDYTILKDRHTPSANRAVTYTFDELVAAWKRARVRIRVEIKGGYRVVWGIVVAQSVVLTVDHISDAVSPLVVEYGGHLHDVPVHHQHQIGERDLMLLYVPALPGGVAIGRKFLTGTTVQADCVMIPNGDSFHRTKGVFANIAPRVCHYNQHTHRGMVCTVSDPQTGDGDCGLPYFVQVGPYWYVGALHSMKSGLLKPVGHGFVTLQDDVSLHVNKISTYQTGVILQTCLGAIPDLHPHNDATRSELACAIRRGARVFLRGESTKSMLGVTPRSKCHSSGIPTPSQLFGVTDEWVPPTFKGCMREGEWISPFQHALVEHPDLSLDQDALAAAMYDYARTVKSLPHDGWRELSDQETVLGITGSQITRLDLSTSVGPPYTGPKRNSVRVIEDEGVYVGRPISEVMEEVEEVLRDGEIPIPVAVWTLKDEPIPKAKDDLRKVRVFNVMSAGYNMVLKKYVAPIQAFIQGNPSMECSVGINMLSDSAHALARELLDVSSDNLLAGDLSKMDKYFQGEHIELVAWVYRWIAQHIGLPHPDYAYRLILGLKSTVYVLKREFFQLAATNPSGSYATVFLNSILTSLMQRYAFYRLVGGRVDVTRWWRTGGRYWEALELPLFSAYCRLRTYGDDYVLAAVRRFSTDRYTEAIREFGFIVTDASEKTLSPQWRNLGGVDYLKRSFRWDDDLEGYVAALSVKSITRMLSVFKPSQLSVKDHQAVVLEDACREVVLHGRDVFLRAIPILRGWRDALEITHPYLKLADFDYYIEQYRLGNFATWQLDIEIPVTLLEDVTYAL